MNMLPDKFMRPIKDADLVFHFESANLLEIAKRLPEGVYFEEQSSFEMVTATRRGILLLEGSNFKIELFHLSEDAFDQTRFYVHREMVRRTWDGRTIKGSESGGWRAELMGVLLIRRLGTLSLFDGPVERLGNFWIQDFQLFSNLFCLWKAPELN